VTGVVLIGGVRLGLVRRTRFGATYEAAVEQLWQEWPPCRGPQLVALESGFSREFQLYDLGPSTAVL
jgi:hypothetical protein